MKSLYSFIILLLFCTACTNVSKEETPEKIVEKDPQAEESDHKFDVKKISIPYNRYTQPCSYNQKIYIPVNIEKDRLQNSILEYDLQTEESIIVYTSELNNAAINDLTCTNEWMVWAETDEFGYKGSIHAWNKNRDEKFVVFEHENPEIFSLDAPRLYENMIAWVTSANGDSEVLLYNLDTKEQTTVAELKYGSFYNNTVDFYDGKLLWTDTVDNTGVYYIYDVETQEVKEHKSSSPYVGYAQLLKDSIISIDFEEVNTWTTGRLGQYNIDSTKTSFIESEFINHLDSVDNHTAYTTKNHELVYYDALSNEKTNLNQTMLIDHTVDSLDFTNDGYLIAGYRTQDFSELFIIEIN